MLTPSFGEIHAMPDEGEKSRSSLRIVNDPTLAPTYYSTQGNTWTDLIKVNGKGFSMSPEVTVLQGMTTCDHAALILTLSRIMQVAGQRGKPVEVWTEKRLRGK